MKLSEIIVVIQILAGTVIILYSLFKSFNIHASAPKKITKGWLISISLAALFFIGSIFSFLSLLANISFPFELISGSLFLGSACFIYMAFKLTKETRSHLQQKTDQHKQAKDKLAGLSLHDGLTGLYNRQGFLTLMDNHVKLAQRQKKRVFLFYADIDNLQGINDTLGFQEGDMMIKDAADVIKANFRRSDIIARVGGDEFIVFLIGTSEDHVETINSNFRKNLEIHNSKRHQKYKLLMKTSVSYYDPEYNDSIDNMLAQAGDRLNEQKIQSV